MQESSNTRRFSNRVENYSQARPTYPPEVMATFRRECGLAADWVVADVGSGTGILSKLLLDNGNRVIGVEPNREMRDASIRLLQSELRFTAVDGSAEATTLGAGSVDLITAGQAFHWFDPVKASVEFRRILKPTGWVALIWNTRKVSDPFMRAYEDLTARYGTDYVETRHENVDTVVVTTFFGGRQWRRYDAPNAQHFDYAGLERRLFSTSYIPVRGPSSGPMLADLKTLFAHYQRAGHVDFKYDTEVYVGQFA